MSILNHSPTIVRDGLVLCLDAGAVRSYPGAGPQLVVNGDFASDITTGWEAGDGTTGQSHDTGTSYGGDGGRLKLVDPGGKSRLYSSAAITTVIGQKYRFSFKVSGGSNQHYVHLGTSKGGTDIVTNLSLGQPDGHFVYDFIATNANFYIYLGATSSSTQYYDQVSMVAIASTLFLPTSGTVHDAWTAVSNQWSDLSGNNNNGTLNNMQYDLDAESGAGGTRSFDFDGASDYIDCGTGFNHTSNLTCEMWAKIDADTGVMFAQWHNSSGKRKWFIGVNSTNILFYIDSAGSGTFTSVDGGAYPTDGEWHHYALVYTPSSSLVAYVDGESVGSDTSSVAASIYSSTDVNIYIGRSEAGEYWDGKIAIARMYTKSLTATEIQRNYRAQKGRFGR